MQLAQDYRAVLQAHASIRIAGIRSNIFQCFVIKPESVFKLASISKTVTDFIQELATPRRGYFSGCAALQQGAKLHPDFYYHAMIIGQVQLLDDQSEDLQFDFSLQA